MSEVGAFIHLYHVWGLFGAITMLVFGRQAYRSWRASGGSWLSAPCEWLRFVGWTLREMVLDIVRVPFIPSRLHEKWPESEWKGRSYPREQSILIGITLGGMGRMFTALYWSERNRNWMVHADDWMIQMAAAPVCCMIVGDFLHHTTAWHNQKHIPRLIAAFGLVWILVGALKA